MPTINSFTPDVGQIALVAGTYTADKTDNLIFKFGAANTPDVDQPLARYTIHIPATTVVNATDEFYDFIMLVSQDVTMAAVTFEAARLRIGHEDILSGDTAMGVGTYRLVGTNEVDGVIYAYGKLLLLMGGTAESITLQDVYLD